MNASTLDLVRIAGDFILVPMMGLLFSLHGRLSRLEGKIESIKKDTSNSHSDYRRPY